MEENTKSSVIGRNLATADRGPSELERLFGNIMQQAEIISMLDSRLDPVLHRAPQDAKEPGRETRPHITDAADQVARNTRRLEQILNEIAL